MHGVMSISNISPMHIAIYHICKYMHTLIIQKSALDTWGHASKQYITYAGICIHK